MIQTSSSLPQGSVPLEVVGQTIGELSTALTMMESNMEDGQKIRVELVTDSMPTDDDLAQFYSNLLADIHHVSRPTTKIVDGFPVTSFVVRKGSPAFAALIPLIPITIIGGLITFGITRIEALSRALMPILLVTFGGLIVLVAVLTRKPVLATAERLALSRGKLQSSTIPLTTNSRLDKLAAVETKDMPPSGVPPVDFAQTEKGKGWKDFYKGNRVQASIDSANYRLEHRKVSKEAQNKLHESLKTDWKDLVQYQQLQSWAFASGKINADEAKQLYAIYGEESPSPEKWDKLTLAEKVAATRFAEELLSLKIKVGVQPQTETTLEKKVRLQWVKATRWEDIPPGSKFVVFSKDNPHVEEYNRLMGELLASMRPKTVSHEKVEGQERVWILSGGGTVFSHNQMVSMREFDEENRKAIARGEMPATGEIWGKGKWKRLPQTKMELLPQEIAKKLPAIGATGEVKDPMVQVKFFTPWAGWTWYAIEYDGKDIFYGWVVGLEKEFGSFSLKELESIEGPFGLWIERDINFDPRPISEVMKEHGATWYHPHTHLDKLIRCERLPQTEEELERPEEARYISCVRRVAEWYDKNPRSMPQDKFLEITTECFPSVEDLDGFLKWAQSPRGRVIYRKWMRLVALRVTGFNFPQLINNSVETISQEISTPIFPGGGKSSEVDLFPDSPEYLAHTVDMTGWRQKLEQTFQTAITRARSS